MSFSTFAWGVMTHPSLNALGHATADTLWAWGNAETAPYDLMRWNNPMNTTEKWYVNGVRVSSDSGAQPGDRDVQVYPTEEIGIAATCYTLLNEPYYGAIVANLRAGLRYDQWGATSAAGAELHAWGTGTAWLSEIPYFGATLPAQLGGQMAQLDDIQTKVADMHATFITGSIPEPPLDPADGTHFFDWFYRWNQQLKKLVASTAEPALTFRYDGTGPVPITEAAKFSDALAFARGYVQANPGAKVTITTEVS